MCMALGMGGTAMRDYNEPGIMKIDSLGYRKGLL